MAPSAALSSTPRPTKPIRLSTSNGTIDVRLQMPRNNDVIASTSNSSITIPMPANAGARIVAQTSSHESISTDFDVQVHGTPSKGRIDGTIAPAVAAAIDDVEWVDPHFAVITLQENTALTPDREASMLNPRILP